MRHHFYERRELQISLKAIAVTLGIGLLYWAVLLVKSGGRIQIFVSDAVQGSVTGEKAVPPVGQAASFGVLPMLGLGLATAYFFLVLFSPESRFARPVVSVLARLGIHHVRQLSGAFAMLGVLAMIFFW